MSKETRHYIGLLGAMRVTFTLGPADPDDFNHGPTDPLPIRDALAYPVSAAVADEWVGVPPFSMTCPDR